MIKVKVESHSDDIYELAVETSHSGLNFKYSNRWRTAGRKNKLTCFLLIVEACWYTSFATSLK